MEILVFIKRVPDTESKIRVAADAKGIVEEGLNFVISPFDEFAVEEALRLREAKTGKVTVLSVGPDETATILKKALAMGVDEAILIKDAARETFDGLRTAKLLAAAVRKRFPQFDLLLFGKQSVGADNGQVPAMTAELLGLPQAAVAVKLLLRYNTAWTWVIKPSYRQLIVLRFFLVRRFLNLSLSLLLRHFLFELKYFCFLRSPTIHL